MTKESPASLTPEERAPQRALDIAMRLFCAGNDRDHAQAVIADALRAAEARGRERGIEEAAHALENPTLRGDLPFVEAADVVRGLSAERQATPPSLPDSAEVATLRLDVAWWRARVEAAERDRDKLRAEVREWLCESCHTVYPGPPRSGFACVICPKCEGLTGPRISMELRAAIARAEAAEAAQAKLTEALREARGCLAISGWDGPVIQKVDAALASVASAPQAPPGEVK